MYDEDRDSIRARVTTLVELDSTACTMLSTACLLIKDDDSARELLLRVREHIHITDEAELMYETNYFLDYVKDLLDILSAIESNGPLPELRNYVRDHYETLLYNRELLMAALNNMKAEDNLDKFRANYWMN